MRREDDPEEDYLAEKLQVYASFPSTFTMSGIIHEHTRRLCGAATRSSRVLVYIFTAGKLSRSLANFPFKINANGDEAKRARTRLLKQREMQTPLPPPPSPRTPCIFGKTAAARSRVALIVQIKNYSTPHHHPFLFSLEPRAPAGWCSPLTVEVIKYLPFVPASPSASPRLYSRLRERKSADEKAAVEESK